MSDPAAVPAAEPATPVDPAAAFAAFEASENAKASGQPDPAAVKEPEPVTEPEPEPETDVKADATPAAVDKSYTPPSPKSKRTAKDQEFINERIRTSVKEATDALQKEIAELKAKAAPAAEPKSEPIVDPKDPEPVETDFETYPAFMRELSKWTIRQDRRELEAASAEQRTKDAAAARDKDFVTRTDTWIDRRDAFAAKTPDFYDKAGDFLDTLTAGTPIGDALIDSDVGPQVALHLATHPEEAARIAALSPVSQLRAVGKLESLFAPLTSASASAGPAAKTVTTAPAPPTTLAARSAAPADPAKAAVDRGDFAAFEEAENRKDFASTR